MAGDKLETGAFLVEFDVVINAPRDKVWESLTEHTSEWWLKDFYTGPAKGFIIEPALGGRMYEDWGDGKGQIWYQVMGVRPSEMLQLTGHLSPAFGGPATSILELTLEDKGGVTTLHVSDAVFGRMTENKRAMVYDGWQTLFGALKSYAEKP